ncbi:hypothetical protein BDN72DRAFT_402073 [Pluteus cervinus]|uniref:Uncharacterized protein n=1 Tax=Pluteus cervinus TaxID=181527 RepID=A0ACD3B1P6_9AGAR|nr:hypothetical protein BDN72DRAFT_402073 [Pluteus cervinus]
MSNSLITPAQSQSPLPTADDIAILLGLREGPSPFITKVWAHEGEREDDLVKLVQRLGPPEQHVLQHTVFAEFGAKYLPATVDRFIEANFDLPLPLGLPLAIFEINNIYSDNVYSILRLHPAYFSKYLRSKLPIASQGKKLARILAERVSNTVLLYSDILLDPGYAWSLARVLELLHLMLDMYAGHDQEPIPADVKKALVVFLKTSIKSECHDLRTHSEALSRLFAGHPRPERITYVGMTRGRCGCGVSGCYETNNLKACAACRTVVYCSTEHQRAHWSSKRLRLTKQAASQQFIEKRRFYLSVIIAVYLLALLSYALNFCLPTCTPGSNLRVTVILVCSFLHSTPLSLWRNLPLLLSLDLSSGLSHTKHFSRNLHIQLRLRPG